MSGWWQLKLTSGEEILANVVHMPHEDDPDQIMLCCDILEIKYVDSPDTGRISYLRPYMVYQCEDDSYSTIQAGNVMVFSKPIDTLKQLGIKAVKALRNDNQRAPDFGDFDDEEYLEEMLSYEDSDGNNIIDFKPKMLH